MSEDTTALFPVLQDPDSVFMAACIVRTAHGQALRLRSKDPTIQGLVDQLDEMAGALHRIYQGERLDLRGGKSRR